MDLLGRLRKSTTSLSPASVSELLSSAPQPIPLVKVVAQPITPGSSTIRYVATGITSEAEQLLMALSGPLFIVAFAGFGRSGKSYTASCVRHHITGNRDHEVSPILLQKPSLIHLLHFKTNLIHVALFTRLVCLCSR